MSKPVSQTHRCRRSQFPLLHRSWAGSHVVLLSLVPLDPAQDCAGKLTLTLHQY